MIHIVGAEHRADEFLHYVVVFIGCLRGAQPGQGIGAVLLFNVRQSSGNQIKRLIPARLAEFAVLFNKRLSQPVILMHVINTEAAFHAGIAVVRDASHLTCYPNDFFCLFIYV